MQRLQGRLPLPFIQAGKKSTNLVLLCLKSMLQTICVAYLVLLCLKCMLQTICVAALNRNPAKQSCGLAKNLKNQLNKNFATPLYCLAKNSVLPH